MAIEDSKFVVVDQAVAYGSDTDLLLFLRKTWSFKVEASSPCAGRFHDSVAQYPIRSIIWLRVHAVASSKGYSKPIEL